MENGRSTAHIRDMETTVGRALLLVVSMAIAAMTASMILDIAFDFGLSREESRAIALVIAASVGAIVAVEHFSKRLRGIK